MVLSNKLIYGKNGFLEKRITNDMGECVTTYTYNEAGFLTSDHQVGEYTEMGADKPEKVDVKNTYKYKGIDDHGNWTRRETVPADDNEEPIRVVSFITIKSVCCSGRLIRKVNS